MSFAAVLLLLGQLDAGVEAAPARFETMISARGAPLARTIRDARLQEVGARTVVDALDYDPSIHATAGARGERIITLRGFAQRQVAVLIDGAPFEIPYDGQIDLDMVPAAMIERIDIAPGPTSVLAGPNGLGGVVDLRTRRAGKGPRLFTQLEGGGLGRFELNARSAVNEGPVSVTFFAGYLQRAATPLSATFTPTFKEDGDARLNSDRRTGYLGLATAYRRGRHTVELTGWFLTGERGMPPSTLDDRPRFWRFGFWDSATVQLGHRYEGDGFLLETMAWWRTADNRVDAYDDDSFTTQRTPRAFISTYDDDSFGARTRGSGAFFESLRWRFWVGAQMEQHHSTANNAPPEALGRVILTAAPELEWQPFTLFKIRGGVQLDAELPLGLAGVQTGAGVGPALSFIFDPHSTLSFTLTGARRTRFPTLRERFSEAMGFRVANPSLRPEAAWHLGLSGTWRPTDWFQFDASGWDAEVTDLIETVRVEGGLEQLQNKSQARLAGVELTAAFKFNSLVRARAGWVGQYVGALEYRPAHQAVVDVAFTPTSWLEFWAGVRVMSERRYTNPDNRKLEALPTAVVLDARIEAGPRLVRGWLRATNLLDANYSTEYGFPMPGRQVLLGVSVSVD
ncbi:MAG: TonB-dependent receptor plug domain-containing protein [Archangium sp.]